MGKKSPAPPPAPDYAGAAQQQGVANLEAARLTARLSNPNVITPLGGQRVTYGRPQFNQNAYNAAMADYRARQPQGAPATGAPPTVGVGGGAAMPTTGGGGVQMGPSEVTGVKYVPDEVNNERDRANAISSRSARNPGSTTKDELAFLIDYDSRKSPVQVHSNFRPQTDMSGAGLYGGGAIGTDMGVSPEPTAMKTDGMPAARRQALGMEDRDYAQGFTTLSTGSQVPTSMLVGGGRLDSSGMGPGQMTRAGQGYDPSFSQYGYSGNAEPTREMFTDMVDLDTPTIEQYLTPEAQATLEAQQRVERAFSGLGEKAIGRVQDVYGTAFTPQGLPEQQFNFGGYGNLPTLPDQQGRARSDVSALPVNFGPTAGQYGMAGGGPQGLNLQGFDSSGLGMAGGGSSGGAFGAAQGGVGAPSLRGQYDLAGVGDVARAPGAAAMAQGGPNAPRLQGQLDTSQLAAMPVNAGMTAQQAIMSRLDPQLQRQRAQLETQLANQGLARGGEAYGAAITEQQQQENDLRTQAALQGISLDMGARQQGLGEAQTLGGFANQSALAGFGAGQQATQFQNAAGQQNFQNELARQAATNQAQGQAFGQRAQAGQFGNEAQLASFQAAMQNQAAGNQAIGQNFGQSQASQAMANQAQQQNFQQRMAAGEFGRDAQLASFQTGQSAQDAANRAISQNFSQGLGAAGAYNAAAGQQFGQDMDIAGLYNAALGQNQAATLQQAQAQAALQSQGFNQAQAQANFQNAQRQAALQEQLALRQLPLNEVAAIMGGAQVQLPQFQAYQGADVAAAPVFAGQQAAGNFAQQSYGNQVSAYNAKMGMYGALGGAVGAAAGGPAGLSGFFTGSDRRLKSNIVRVATHPLGIGVYEYDIAGKRQRGVMADEVEKVMPEAVVTRSDGIKMVNYGMLQ